MRSRCGKGWECLTRTHVNLVRIEGQNGEIKLKNWTSLLSGAVLLLVAASWTALSHEFVYGQGHSERPIIEYLLLYLVAWGAFLFGLLGLFRKQGRVSLTTVLFVAVAARALLLPSDLVQENDVYRYVLDGQVTLHGENPFEFSPLILPEMASDNLRESLQFPEAQLVLERIGYPEVSTIYPPVAQLAFAAGAALTGWDWRGQRIVFLVVDILLICVLILVLRLFALSGSWVMIYAWNPLVLKEITNSAHLDVLVALFLLLMLWGLFLYAKGNSSLWMFFTAVALGLAVLSKLYPVLLIPACLVYLYRIGAGTGRIVQFCLIVAGTVLLGYLPFLSVDPHRLTSGLSTYAQQWRMNDGVFALLAALFPAPRLIAGIVISVAAILIPLVQSGRSVRDLGTCFQQVLLVWYLTIPTPFPWYAVPLVALAATAPFGAASMVTVVLSGATGLYYLSFFFEYHEYSKDWWVWTRVVEHSIIWLSIPLFWFFQSSNREECQQQPPPS